MDYEDLKRFTNNEIEPYLQSLEMWQCITSLGIKPVRCKGQWCYTYASNLHEEIRGFGDTIDMAALNFYNNLKSGKLWNT